MELRPFTKEEAEKICADFQYLVGRELLAGEARTKIQYVLVCPFDFENHIGFIEHYHINHGFAGYDYINPKGEYDVIAIEMAYPSGYYPYQRIRKLCADWEIDYVFPS